MKPGMTSMRTLIISAAAAAAAFGATVSLAADISPGLWEISMETRVASDPGFAPEPFRVKQCLTADDARDPARLLGSMANPGATGCTFSERKYTGDTLTFAMQCTGGYGIVPRGQVTFTSDTMSGNITATANVGGQNVELQNKVSARRIGGC
jgi:hypothetical protein